MRQVGKLVIMAVGIVLFTAYVGFAAYNHSGDTDSVNFRAVYPDKVGTKLDNCTLCHRGSEKSQGDPVTYGSCQWCHYI